METRSWRESRLREDSSTLHGAMQRGQKRSGALASGGRGQSKANRGGRLTGDLTGGAVFLCLVPCWHNPIQVPRDALGKDVGVFLNVLHVGQLQGLRKPESHIT